MNSTGFLSSAARRIRSQVSGQDGIALLMVLVVITLLATLVVSFTDTTQKHLQVTQYYKNRVQAYWAAQSGLQAAAGLLKNDPETQGYNGPGSLWNCESAQYQEFVLPILANVFCESSMIEPALLLSQASTAETETTLSRCPPAAPILDENRKLSIARLVTNPGAVNETTDEIIFKRLAYLLKYLLREEDLAAAQEQESLSAIAPPLETGITIEKAQELAGYLVDWMDTPNNKNAERNPDTAEESCPADELPYEAKQGMLDSVDEIGLVCGFRQMSRMTIEKLTQHLTNYDLKTNINTATVPVLYAFFTEDLEKAEDIYRQLHPTGEQEPTKTVEQGTCTTFLADAGIDATLSSTLCGTTSTTGFGFKSEYFRIGIYGVVFDKETGTVSVRARLQMDVNRQQGGQLSLLYYRED